MILDFTWRSKSYRLWVGPWHEWRTWLRHSWWSVTRCFRVGPLWLR